MNEKHSKKILMQFISSENEDEIKRIIDSDSLLSNEKNWKPYGGYEGNFNTINNQAKILWLLLQRNRLIL